MTDLPLRASVEDAIAVLTMSAPSRRNAISTEMRTELLRQLRALSDDPQVRALVLTGDAGHFSSGGDIGQMPSTGQPGSTGERLELLHACVRILAGGPKPVVAAVQGVAFGAGMSLALACDWIVAGQGARFGAAFGKVGLLGDCGLLWTLPRRVGDAAARNLLLTARIIDAQEAHAIGMADEVVPDGDALARALAKCKEYIAVAPRAIAATKAVLSTAPASLDELLRLEAQWQGELRQTQDAAEGRLAFKEKRPPVFTGR